MADYFLYGFKFGTNYNAGTPGGNVTWAFDSTVPAYFQPIVAAAFTEWSNHANIQFSEVAPTASPTILISSTSVDGPGKKLTTGEYTYRFNGHTFNEGVSAKLRIDSDENWHPSGNDATNSNGASLLSSLLYSIGQVIGVRFTTNSDSLMALTPSKDFKYLTQYDDKAIQSIYGGPPNLYYLVDRNYYSSHNSDVSSLNIDLMSHYNSFGWHEARNPNAFFSTSGYLAANADVARLGLNPLDHYDQFGWREGRDPNAHFDNELYLKHNPDVQALGIDPLLHYLRYGQAEGRETFDAIGKASSFTHGSFDPEYYLLANPDIAKIASAQGGDTFAFAYKHYHNYGWEEGRKADAYFDTAYYLKNNSDVAALHIDPLTHYDQYGWKEGRNPSADFDTKAYLAANPDVAAAHIDPLLHYLQYGAAEGRHLI